MITTVVRDDTVDGISYGDRLDERYFALLLLLLLSGLRRERDAFFAIVHAGSAGKVVRRSNLRCGAIFVRVRVRVGGIRVPVSLTQAVGIRVDLVSVALTRVAMRVCRARYIWLADSASLHMKLTVRIGTVVMIMILGRSMRGVRKSRYARCGRLDRVRLVVCRSVPGEFGGMLNVRRTRRWISLCRLILGALCGDRLPAG